MKVTDEVINVPGEKYIKNHPNDKWLLVDRMALTAGYKSAG